MGKRGIYRLDDLPVAERTKAILKRHRFTRAELRRMTPEEIEVATCGKLSRERDSIAELHLALTPGMEW